MRYKFLFAFFLAIFLIGSVSAFDWGDSTRAYWGLNENTGTNAVDSVSSVSNGTLISSPSWSTGIIGSDLHFAGSTNYVNISNNANLKTLTTMTVSGWFKTDTGSGSNRVIFAYGKDDGLFQNYFQLQIINDELRIQGASGGSTDIDVSTNNHPLQVGTWYYYTFVLNSTGNFIYLNGTQVPSARLTYATGSSSTSTTGFNFNEMPSNFAMIGASSASGSVGTTWLGDIDELGIWARALSPSEILELYNNGAGLPYNTGITITLNSPDGAKSISNTMNFNSSVALTSGTLSNVTLTVLKAGSPYTTSTQTLTGTSANPIFTLNNLPKDSYTWNVQYCTLTYCVSGTSKSFEIIGVQPVLDAPADAFNSISTIKFNATITNSTATEGTLTNATLYIWNSGNTITNQNAISISGLSNTTTWNVLPSAIGSYTWNVFGCSLSGCSWGASNRSFVYGYKVNSVTYSPALYTGTVNSYILNMSSSSEITSANLIFNSVSYPASLISAGTENIISNSLFTPLGVSNGIFNWTFTIGGTNFSTSTYTQGISSIPLDNCTTQTARIMNFNLYDEDTLNAINGTIESVITMYTYGTKTVVANYSAKSTNGFLSFCTNTTMLNTSSYTLDYQTKYYQNTSGSIYASESKYGQNITVNLASTPYNYSLYLILFSEELEFTVNYRNQYYVIQPGVLVDIQRQYIPTNTFLSVETPQTDNAGNALAHLIPSSQVYNIIISKDGKILATFSNVIAKCQTATQCEINLNEVQTTIPKINWQGYNNVYDVFTIDKTTRLFTMLWKTIDSTPQTVSWNVLVADQFGNNTICTNSLTSSSGTFTCTIPSSYGNISVFAQPYINGVALSPVSTSLGSTPGNVFGGTRVILGIIMYSTLALLFVSSPVMMVVGALLGMVFAGLFLFLDWGTSYGFIGVGSVILWFIIAGIILIIRAQRRMDR